MQQLILDIRPDAPAGFDNFLPGPNLEPLQALRERVRLPQSASPMTGEHVLYLWGEPGVGKSHLLRAWATASDAPCLTGGPLPDMDRPLLAVDDVQALDEEAQVRLFALLNNAREHGGRIVAAGPLPPARLAIRADLATRLAQGLVFRLQALSDADKAQALQVRAAARGMELEDELVRYMLLHCRRDLPHLLAIVDGLDTFSLSRKRSVSLGLLKTYLQTTPA